jgi:glycosyltransferase involved in cell wall biosynthesis
MSEARKHPLRVTVDLTAAVQGHAGLGRYAEELARGLLADCPPDEELAIFYNDAQHRRPVPPLDALPAIGLPWSSKPWRLAVLLAQLAHVPQDTTLGRPDIFLATQHLLPRVGGGVTVFTLHDLIFRHLPEAHLPLNRWFLNLAVPRFLAAADAIIAISECTRRDAMRFYGVPDRKIHVIYEAADTRFRPIADEAYLAGVRRRYGLPERFVLYVGTIEPRKNLPILFRAFKAALPALSGCKLVICGKKGWLYDETFASLQALGIEREVCFTGFVPDADLPGLYALAEALALPSRYEGFGLPVLEAMGCGTPVICSNASSLPEIAGDAALLVPPDDVAGWTAAMSRLMGEPGLQRELRARGLAQAARFSWTKAAQQTRALYREVYRARRP